MWKKQISRRFGNCFAQGIGNGLGWFLGIYIAYKLSDERLYALLDHALNVLGAIFK